MNIIVYDITGFKVADQQRADYLISLLRVKNIKAEKWPPDLGQQIKAAETIILAHSSDLSDSVEKQFRSIAEAGGLLVIYSAGDVYEEEMTVGAGWLYKRHWNSITESLSGAPLDFELQDFRSILDNLQQRNLLVALAILSWCVSAPVNSKAVLKKQEAWRKSPVKWREVFSGISEERFLQAINPAMTGNQEWPKDLSELKRLVKWIVPPSAAQASGDLAAQLPDELYTKALEQISNRFGWKL
jgi:hypothetical protein